MSEIPKQIYLQWHGDATVEQAQEGLNEFNREVCTEDITWCDEKQFNSDIGPYVLNPDCLQVSASIIEERDALRAKLAELSDKQLAVQKVVKLEEMFQKSDAWASALLKRNKDLELKLAEFEERWREQELYHAACGVIVNANTPKSLAMVTDGWPSSFDSGSMQDCIKAVKREIALRDELKSTNDRINGLQVELQIAKQSQMTEERAREVLGDTVRPDNSLRNSFQYIAWSLTHQPSCVVLDSEFEPDELEAIAWWMRNKGVGE
jgi:hypothetical protein